MMRIEKLSLKNGKNIMEIKDIKIKSVWYENESIYIETDDGATGFHPLEWFPKLKNGTKEQRMDFELSPFGIHWPKLDEDLSFEGFFNYKKKK